MTEINDLYRSRLTSAGDALGALPRRCSVLLGFFAAQPPALVQALADRAGAGEFDELRVHYMHATPATTSTRLNVRRAGLTDVVSCAIRLSEANFFSSARCRASNRR